MDKYFSLCFILILQLSGCATILEHKPLIIRSEAPEVSGNYSKLDINVALENSDSRVYATLDRETLLGNNLGDSGKAKKRNSLFPGINAKLGLTNYMDVYARASLDAPSSIGGKIQLLGFGRDKGWKITTSAEFGILNDDKNGKNSGFSESYRNITVKMQDVSVNIGYRFDSEQIVYINSFYSTYNVDGLLYRTEGPLYSTNGWSKGYGTLVGIRSEFAGQRKKSGSSRNPLYMTFEIGFVNLNWLDTLDHKLNLSRDNSHLTKKLIAIGVSFGKSWR